MPYYTARCTYCDLELGSESPQVLTNALEPLRPDREGPDPIGPGEHHHSFVVDVHREESAVDRLTPAEVAALADVDARLARLADRDTSAR